MYLKKFHDRLVNNVEGVDKYKLLKSYAGTYIEKQMQNEESLLFPYFRVFNAAKPERNRKLNVDPTHEFDIYNNSLLDYASIIGYKLKRPWVEYNRLISIQIPYCPNDCWHCYLPKSLYAEPDSTEDRYEELSASEIVENFLKQRSYDLHNGIYSNVLRITGGEPFLVPELILECLQIIEGKNLSDQVFVWTETNLQPFVGDAGKAFMDSDENKDVLNKLSNFKNLAVHPCFHGLDREEISNITSSRQDADLDGLINAISRLAKANIDVYPTIGSNVVNPKNLETLFNKLKALRNNLPLKLALINYDLDYEPVAERLLERDNVKLYSRFSAIRIWNKLLMDNYGVGYGILPRHLPAKEQPTIHLDLEIPEYKDDIIYMFKSSMRSLYHREVLDIIAFPTGYVTSNIEYEAKWVQKDLFFHISKLKEKYMNKEAIFCYVEEKTRNLIPLRQLKILDVTIVGKIIKFSIQLNSLIEIKGDIEIFSRLLRIYFGQNTLPPIRTASYVLLGEHIIDDENGVFNISKEFMNEELELEVSLGANSFPGIATTLSKYEKLRHSLFYRVNNTDLELNTDNPTNPYYMIDAGKGFKISLEYYMPNYENFDETDIDSRTIRFELSTHSVQPITPNNIVLSKYGSQDILFSVDDIEVEEDFTLTFRSVENQFDAPSVKLNFKILSKKKKKIVHTAIASLFLILGIWGLNIIQGIDKAGSLWDSIGNHASLLWPNLRIGLGNVFFILMIFILFAFVIKAVHHGQFKKFW